MTIKKYPFLLLFLFPGLLISQSIFNKPITPETFPEWDAYIKKYAPSDSALRAVETIAQRQHFSSRSAVAREAMMIYRPYFRERDAYFRQSIDMYEGYMLTQSATPDIFQYYEKFIHAKVPSEEAFVALQRITDYYINLRKWDSAAIIYNSYKSSFPNMEKRFNKIIEILQAPTEGLHIRNLGKNINTNLDEWDPNPTPDGKYLFFSTTNRPDGYGGMDVFVSKFENGEWQKSQNVGRTINGPNNETIDNVTADGTGLLLSGTFEGTFGEFDIYYAGKHENGWGGLEHYPFPINTKFVDEGGNLTSDGKALLFTSDRPGGIGDYAPYNSLYHGSQMGNMDIYVCLKTDSGWSAPINLGPVINTPFAERSPYLHPDGKTLYFSSDGHPGLGRLDVFKTVRLREDSWTEWSEPENLGKEINTVLDDWGYKIGVSGDSAVFAGNWRTDGFGGWDLYSVTLPKVSRPNKVVTIKGKVKDSNGKPLSADLKWEDLKSGKNVGILKSNPTDGSYIILLPLGKLYGYYAERSGFYPTSKNIDLRKAKNDTTIIEDIILVSLLQMKEEKTKVRINNIFFDFDEYYLLPESFPELDRLAAILLKDTKQKVEIDGHTDIIGKAEYNVDLSLKRAQTVRDYLVSKGLDESRFIVKGFGTSKPVADNTTEEGRSQNRRVEIWFVE